MKLTSMGLSPELLEASRTVLQNSNDYEEFFQSALKKFGVDSPADFKSDEEKKKFFDYIDKNNKGKNKEEVAEGWKKGKYTIKDENGKILGTYSSGGKAKKVMDDLMHTGDYPELTVSMVGEVEIT